jgi:hypothetical protein
MVCSENSAETRIVDIIDITHAHTLESYKYDKTNSEPFFPDLCFTMSLIGPCQPLSDLTMLHPGIGIDQRQGQIAGFVIDLYFSQHQQGCFLFYFLAVSPLSCTLSSLCHSLSLHSLFRISSVLRRYRTLSNNNP